MSEESEIIISEIVKNYKNKCVLDHISLQLQQGKIHGLLGASGSGKTTLLNVIMGSLTPNSGEVHIQNKQMPNRQILNHIGYMPQQDGLYQELSLYDNLRFFAGIQKLHGKEFTRKAQELLEVVGLAGEENTLVMNCSGGMKKRVSLIASLIHSPSILLLDEPTVGIDPVLRRQIWEYLQQLKAGGTTILITTHVMDEVDKCDTAALLRDGHILLHDTIDELKKISPDHSIESLFFLDPSIPL